MKWLSKHKDLLLLQLFFILVSLLAVRVFWNTGFPYTHDGENHLARFANYFVAIREGQWPPRFAPSLFSGYGFPVFVYNYPLANILAVPFMALKVHPEKIFAFQAFLALYIMTASCWYFLRKKFSPTASWLGTLSVVFSSAVQSNLFFRGNIGELWAMSLVLACFALWSWRKNSYRITNILLPFLLAAFFLSHNVLAVFFSPFLLIWQLLSSQKNEWKVLLRAWTVAMGLSVWFWIPALAEMSYVVLGSDELAQQAALHALTFQQIFLSPLRFGFSREGVIDNFGWGLGLSSIAMSWLGFVLLFTRGAQWKNIWPKHKELFFFVILFALSIFMSSTASTFVWESAPVVSLMQFPWRWLSFATLSLPYLMAFVYSQSNRWGRRVLLFLMLLGVGFMAQLEPADRFHKEALSYRQFPHATLTRNENRPKTLTSNALPTWEPGPEVIQGTAQNVQVIAWNGSYHEYTIQPQTDLLVREKTVFFPGWRTEVNGQKVEPFFDDQTLGLIAYKIASQEGEVKVITSFSERTPDRVVAELISALTFFAFVFWCVWNWKRDEA